jgi:hypothetical protein
MAEKYLLTLVASLGIFLMIPILHFSVIAFEWFCPNRFVLLKS